MLAKKHRLNLALTENSQMFRAGLSQQFAGENLLFYYRPNNGGLKIAAIAPSRIYPKAHQRNHYRRLLYQLIVEIDKEIKELKKPSLFDKDLDLIVVYKKQDFVESDLKKDLITFFRKYEII